MTRPAFLICLLSLACCLSAQKIDSLKRLIDNATEQDTALVKRYLDLGALYENNSPDTAEMYYLKAGALSEALDYVEGICGFAAYYGYILNLQGMFDSSLVINRRALEAALAVDNGKQAAKAYASMGNSYHYKGDFQTALKYYLTALAYFEQTGSNKEVIFIYDCLQNLYYLMLQCDKGVEYGEKALAMLQQTPDEKKLVSVLINLSNNYVEVIPSRLEDAYNALSEALKIAQKNNDLYHEALIEGNISDIFLRNPTLENLQEMEKHILRSYELHRQYGDESGLCVTYRGMAYIEFERHNFDKAREWLLKALEIAKETDIALEQMKCCNMLAKTELAAHNYQKYREYDYQYDSLASLTVHSYLIASTRDLEVKYESEKKQLEIERQQRELEKRNTERLLFTGGLALVLVFMLLLSYMLSLRTRRNRALSERNAALTEMNATKDKFFSIISHDLKNPAIAMRDAIKLLSDKGLSWDKPSLEEYYNALLHSADGQVELLYNLLRWAQVQTGRMIFRPMYFDLIPRVKSELRLVRVLAERKGVVVVDELPDNALVTADADMLTTIIRNLLTNAVKFTPQGGTVRLTVTAFSDGGSEGHIRVKVEDTGVGMTPEQLENLFRIDSNQSRTGTAGEQGTGLGLTVCRDMLMKHNSTLHVESEAGKGSVFGFEI